MAWVRLDDHFAQHPKVVSAGPLAMAMQVAAICYCNRELTDGFVPRAVARTLIDCDPAAGVTVTCPQLIDRLLEAGMWEEAPGGYRIHDFLEYQPSKEEVLELREKRAEAGRLGGQKRAENLQLKEAIEANPKQRAKQSSSKPEANPKQNSNPVPVPVPVPVSRLPSPVSEPGPAPESLGAPEGAERETVSALFLEFWQEWQTGITRGHGGRKPAYAAWKRVGLDRASAGEKRERVRAGLARWKASAYWRQEGGRFVMRAERWLGEELWQDDPPDVHARASPNGVAPKKPAGPAEFALLAGVDVRGEP